MAKEKVLIIGSRGALGKALTEELKTAGYAVYGLDKKHNEACDKSVILNQNISSLERQGDDIMSKLMAFGSDLCFRGIICVAGGWIGGNIEDQDFLKNSELMWKQSVEPCLIAARISTAFLDEKGFLIFTGAAAAVNPTAGMIAYGMAKNSVHYFTKCLSQKDSGFKGTVVALLPQTLDTENNRKAMPNVDHSSWTPLEYVSKLIISWMKEESPAPASGSLIELITKGGKSFNKTI